MRVVAALSGGVDSSVAAARAVAAGHEVVGIHLALSSNPASTRRGSRGCCSLEDSRDARRVADLLDIPFYVWDLSDEFRESVVEDFVAEYHKGRTPNPCLRCNEKIKFSALLDRALALGFDAVATGHYAQVVTSEHGGSTGYELHRSVDTAKDQSYVLAVMPPESLPHALFPVGDSTKDQIRAEADAWGFAVASKPDSHDICFIPDGDTAGFLARQLGERPGDIVDEAGAVVGAHTGSYAYTIGQRKGLHLDRPASDGKPRYVLSIEPVNNRVVVGPENSLTVHELSAVRPIWFGSPPEVGVPVGVQVRAHGKEVSGVVTAVPTDSGSQQVKVRLDEPIRGVAAGQALVLYSGTRVLGSGTLV